MPLLLSVFCEMIVIMMVGISSNGCAGFCKNEALEQMQCAGHSDCQTVSEAASGTSQCWQKLLTKASSNIPSIAFKHLQDPDVTCKTKCRQPLGLTLSPSV